MLSAGCLHFFPVFPSYLHIVLTQDFVFFEGRKHIWFIPHITSRCLLIHWMAEWVMDFLYMLVRVFFFNVSGQVYSSVLEKIIIIIFLLLFKYSWLHFPSPLPLPPIPTLVPTPFGFVHGSFIHVPWWPFLYFPPLSPFPLPSGYCQFVPYFNVSGSILLICLFCRLGSTYTRDYMVFVFHVLVFPKAPSIDMHSINSFCIYKNGWI